MRRGNDPKLIYDASRPGSEALVALNKAMGKDDPGLLLGVNFGADFTAEHEWGISPIKRDFGIPEDIAVYGLARRKVTTVPKDSLRWVTFESTHAPFSWKAKTQEKERPLQNGGFIFRPHWYDEHPEDHSKNRELRGEGLRAAWSDKDFGAVSSERVEIDALFDIFSELQKGNAVITFGDQKFLENPGLVIAVADRLPAVVLDDWYNGDKGWHDIRKEVDATGIEAELKIAGKRWFSLRPKRDEGGGLLFWLNPCEQDKHNYGWFKLEHLREWAQDKGPIPMTAAQQANRKRF